MTGLLRRTPFTLLMLLGISATGIITGSAVHPLDPELLRHWGFALHDLWDGTWYSLVTAVLFTNRPLMFWGILPFAALSIGGYEYIAGTRRAVALYWITDLGGSLASILVLVLPLYLAGTALGETLAYADDVGMSGGGFGCVGACVHRLSPGRRRTVAVGVLIYLLARLVFFTELYADVLHLLTFTGGFWLDRVLSPKGG